MGLDFHSLNFVRYAGKKQPLGNVITIGRQELHVNESALKRGLALGGDYVHEAYCEPVLKKYIGATNVDSIDNSSYEDATFIHDMNVPLPEQFFGKYDTVIDAGTTEHIYRVPQALENYSRLCKAGGQIIHILPANNYCGHGFWQFSPEFFFSLYSGVNGYKDTEVFLSDLTDKWKWYEVAAPKPGDRVNVLSFAETYVMVRTVLAREDFSHAIVQQSDYMHEWEHGKAEVRPRSDPKGIKGKLVQMPLLYDRLFPLYHRLSKWKADKRLSDKNPGLSARNVKELV